MNLIWINSAKYLGDYRLSLSFSNGEERIFDAQNLARLIFSKDHVPNIFSNSKTCTFRKIAVPLHKINMIAFMRHILFALLLAIPALLSAQNRLTSIQRLVASGEGEGLQKGKQIYFGKDGKVESMEIFTLVHDERKGKTRNRLASETILYPDGKTREEVQITYITAKNGSENKTYTRKIYYPDGALQYEESMGEKGEQDFVYYKPDGKKNMHPKERFALYLTMPEFPGGIGELWHYLSESVKYPADAQAVGAQGRVILQFVVAKNGKIEDIEVVRSGGHPSLDAEAKRVIRSMPKWQPGTQRGKPVRVKYTVPVNFRLE